MTIDPPITDTTEAMSAGGADTAVPVAETAASARGEDPYRDFELYLEKVQDELSEVFEQWETTQTSDRRKAPNPPERISSKVKTIIKSNNNNQRKINGDQIHKNGYNNFETNNIRRRERSYYEDDGQLKAEDAAWSEGIVAEVNSIIYQQLRVLEDERNDTSSTSSSTFTKTLEIREPRDQYTQTTPNSLSPATSSVTWPSEYSLYDTCRNGIEEENDNKSSSASCSSYNEDEAANSKEELSYECLGSGDSLDGISTSSAYQRKRCWLGMGHGIRNPSSADDAMTQPSSAENLLTDSRSEEVDSGIGILSDVDKIHNGLRAQSRMTVDCEEGEFYDDVDDEEDRNKRTMEVMMELGTKSSSDPVLKTRTDEDGMIGAQKNKKKSYTLSNQKIPEIEVIEACKWLKAAGFPQYAQMYEELPFPVDLSTVKEDHPFLDPDSLRSLYRRLGVLNRCALLKLESQQKHNKHVPDSVSGQSTSASTTSTTSSSSNTTGATSKGCGKGTFGKLSKIVNQSDDSDDEDISCALSEAWTYQPRERRWSRIADDAVVVTTASAADDFSTSETGQGHRSDTSPLCQNKCQDTIKEFDLTSVVCNLDEEEIAGAVGGLGLEVGNAASLKARNDLSFPPRSDIPEFLPTARPGPTMLAVPHIVGAGDIGNMASGSSVTAATANNGATSPANTSFHRTNSERIRDGAKAFLRHVESFKTRHRKKHHRDGVVIGDPQAVDPVGIEQKLSDLQCIDISPTHLNQGKFLYADDTSSYCSEGSQSSINGLCKKMNNSVLKDQSEGRTARISSANPRTRRFLEPQDASASEGASSCSMRSEDTGAMSDSDCHHYFRDANSNHTGKKECSTLDRKICGFGSKGRKLMRTGSLTVKTRRERDQEREDAANGKQRHRRDSDSNAIGSAPRRLCEDIAAKAFGYEHHRMPWHSFDQKPAPVEKAKEYKPEVNIASTSSETSIEIAAPFIINLENSPPIDSLSCGQMHVLKKVALLTLTAYMEKFCPTHRSGWNWELPKFIRKTRPNYKNKVAFGVPLSLTMQRTGHAIPKCILKAFEWLQNNALEQVGLFRKSGVKSRIQALKQLIETQGDDVSFEGQQAYDVADVVKQYFRELPEALLTSKFSETFISIFQVSTLDVPESKQHEALSCVLLLLPDEHREALQALLEFLGLVAEQVHHNQMTIRNIAVCLAPSLFHYAHKHGYSYSLAYNGTPTKSPRRKKGSGIPDAKELNATKASHDCLQFLIQKHKTLFRVSEECMEKGSFSYMDQSIPLFREQLGSDSNQSWLTYQYECTNALLKEARKESRGWTSFVHPYDPLVDVTFKKVGDGHPLRLWKVTTEVEAPPQEVLHSILNERKVWDPSLIRSFVVERPVDHCDVFCYTTASMASLPPREFCVLRSWRTDLTKGACCMVETSVKRPMTYTTPPGTPKIEHSSYGVITGVVLASRYFIEPCGSGRSRVMHLSRVDTKGRTLEFYTKIYGHVCADQLTNLRKAFVIKSEGPESKV
ncbi:rho GTPase-activating protein 7 isoform X3 [Ctenocephalides felis]|uniref:rho GTPase-activating protein 7 isoform X3 n=1 Tax=Ctenocephalides felis TaxID=7515 RepID=UPI000E6E5A72|nr:rho GTPase-activating protein 7 isoform X3 [Ctenocephalides felis]